MNAADPLGVLQLECCDLISANPAFAHVPVISEDTGDAANIYERAMGTETVTGGLIGACVTVATLNADTNFENVPGPYLDDVSLIAFVEENVQTNRDSIIGTNQRARALATLIASLWHQVQTFSTKGPLVVIKPSIQRLISFDKLADDGKVAYRVNARANLLLNANLPQVATPVISNTSSSVSVSCATAGAALFYTLDGSNPSPRNGTLYTAPFTPSAALTLKVRGWLAGYLASEPAMIITDAAPILAAEPGQNLAWVWIGTVPATWLLEQSANGTTGWTLFDVNPGSNFGFDGANSGAFYRVSGQDAFASRITPYSNVVLAT
jgi:hypothetical protein